MDILLKSQEKRGDNSRLERKINRGGNCLPFPNNRLNDNASVDASKGGRIRASFDIQCGSQASLLLDTRVERLDIAGMWKNAVSHFQASNVKPRQAGAQIGQNEKQAL